MAKLIRRGLLYTFCNYITPSLSGFLNIAFHCRAAQFLELDRVHKRDLVNRAAVGYVDANGLCSACGSQLPAFGFKRKAFPVVGSRRAVVLGAEAFKSIGMDHRLELSENHITSQKQITVRKTGHSQDFLRLRREDAGVAILVEQ
eukprot:COSAG02_NODE_1457_length_12507_cov_7.416989_5_plen_145_part_00